MKRAPWILPCLLAIQTAAPGQQPSVKIEKPQMEGSRTIEKTTETAVIRDYLEAWTTMQTALERNQAAALEASFVGTALDKITNTIEEQTKLAVHARYHAQSHNLQFVFYSPEGSSIQLIDTVDYDEQVYDHDKLLTTKPIHERYLVVLTPSDVRWRVRIFQAEAP
jgi:hypothetical protein